jgi:hypothetical protein
MGSAIRDRKLRVARALRAVHRLQKEMRESEALVACRLRSCLRKHELELVAVLDGEGRLRLGTHADPVDASRHGLRSIRLDGDAKAACAQRVQQRLVQLQQRLAAGANDEAVRFNTGWPCCENGLGERIGIRKAAASWAVGSDEVGIAESAYRPRAILFTPRPEIATPRTAEIPPASPCWLPRLAACRRSPSPRKSSQRLVCAR